MKSELGNQLRWNSAQRNKTLKGKKTQNIERMKDIWKCLIVQRGCLKAKATRQEGSRSVFHTKWEFSCFAKCSRFGFLIFKLHNKNVEAYPDARRYGCMLFT